MVTTFDKTRNKINISNKFIYCISIGRQKVTIFAILTKINSPKRGMFNTESQSVRKKWCNPVSGRLESRRIFGMLSDFIHSLYWESVDRSDRMVLQAVTYAITSTNYNTLITPVSFEISPLCPSFYFNLSAFIFFLFCASFLESFCFSSLMKLSHC